MKMMIRLFVYVIAFVSVTGLNAQNPQRAQTTPEERAKRDVATIKEQLALTDSQTVKYEKIALKYAKMREELSSIPRDSMQLRRKKTTEMNDKKKLEVKPILSADQFAKYEKLPENSGRMGGGQRGGGGPRPGGGAGGPQQQ